MLVDYLVEDNKNVTAKEYMGIFGNPIKHTLSPVIHDTLSEAFGIDAKYVPYQIPVEKLDAAVKEAYTNGMLGLNITVPFKQQVMESLVDIDPAARAIGAVNTLVRGAGGFVGYNTDMPGLARAIASEGLKLQNSKVILLGAGGAARAVAYMCLKYGANKVYIINRTFENAKKLADDMNACFMCEKMIPVSAADYKMIPKDSYFMLQCTSIGLHENDGLPLIDDVSFYEMASAGVDLIYNPAKTPFLCLLKKLGIPCMNGLKMLLYQGIMAYELWTGKEVSDTLSEKVYRNLCKKIYGDKIVLIGYMGVGKTTIGKHISEEYGYKFIDTDALIEQNFNMKISDIFEKYGEMRFREMETELLRTLTTKNENYVISTGGGLPLREENQKLLKTLGKVYYLQADADTIYSRVKGDKSRPLLDCEDPYNKICSMLAIRDPKYRSVADECIDVTQNTPAEIASKIIQNN